jgi:uncharacterized protein involved in response to NO
VTAQRTFDIAPVARGGAVERLIGAPHRFFFLGGMAQLAAASLWWLWMLAARVAPDLPSPPAAVAPTVLHGVLMLAGFCPLFMFGFLFTAGPRWLGVPAPVRDRWLAPGAVAMAGALLLVPLQMTTAWAVQAAAGVYAAGWLWLAWRFLALLRASAAPDKVHATLVLAALTVGVSTVAAFAFAGAGAQRWIREAGLWGFLLPAFVVVCHRMIPFFTANVAPAVAVFRPWWLLATMVGAPVAHAVVGNAGYPQWTWLTDLPAAALMLWLTLRWGLVQSLANRLLAMLHVGFVWYAIGFLLAGLQSAAALAGTAVFGLAPLHAFAIGFAASLLMAMVTRVSCGHSGRTLAADGLTWRLFQLLQLAAVARVAAEVLPGQWAIIAAAALWCASVVPWSVKYAPAYWQPRADGRPD